MARGQLLAMLTLASAGSLFAAERRGLRVGVFDQRAAGGQGASVQGLIEGLKQQGYEAEAITDLHCLRLLQYDVVYLSDMHKPGRVHKKWRKTLGEYVRNGGSVLQTWHHHVLGEVGVGVRRVYGKRRMHVVKGHPAVAGVADFDASFQDHIVERVGRAGKVLLTNEAGEAVAVAGRIGKGKVISTGLALAIPNGNTSRPARGAERKLLEAFLAWLRPEIPRQQRLADAIRRPTMYVSPSEGLVAAGFDAAFRVLVGSRKGTEVHVECPGAKIEPGPSVKKDPRTPAALIRIFDVTVHAEPHRDVRRELTIRAKVGDQVLEQKVRLEAVYGKPPEDEVRGVWLHVRPDRHPKVVMPELKRLGIKLAVLRIAGGTAAFYGSKVQPDIQDPLAPGGDWLAEAVRHAHANGIEIHPYVNNCVVEGRTSKGSLARLRAAGRLQQGPDGKPINWFCPSQEANIEAMERPMLEIVTRYKVDGVQYDFIRYPNARGCFCPKCRARFEKETGRAVANWPADVVSGPRRNEWIEYRCGRISAVVERISTRIRKAAPTVKISAAVFRDWPRCRETNGQDWVRWCKEGWLDFVCPMNYTLDARLFDTRARMHRQAVPKGFPILQGISIRSSAGGMTGPEQLAVQIAMARRAGAAGFVGFCYTPKHTASLFGPLRNWLDTGEQQ